MMKSVSINSNHLKVNKYNLIIKFNVMKVYRTHQREKKKEKKSLDYRWVAWSQSVSKSFSGKGGESVIDFHTGNLFELLVILHILMQAKTL